MASQQRIRSNGVDLAIWTRGGGNRPTVVMVHGYPDDHRLWDGVAERLQARYRVAAYDVRGAGGSSTPGTVRAYRLPILAADLAAVVDTISPDRPVHLVGHDWGSIQCWEAVTEPGLRHRIASFTSISGPCLDHVGQALRRRSGSPGGLLRQLQRSWYIGAFHVPGLAPLAWRAGLAERWPALLERWEGVRVEPRPKRAADAANGVKLYRANMIPRLLRPRPRTTDVPVQLVLPTHDRFVGPDLFSGLAQWAPNLVRREVDAGHWLPLSHPQALAGFIETFIQDIEGGQAPPADQEKQHESIGA